MAPKLCKFTKFGDMHGPKPCKFTRFGDMHTPKPCKLTTFGDIHGPKPCKFARFGDMHGPRPSKLIRFGDMHGPKPYTLTKFGDIHGPKPCKLKGLVTYMAPNLGSRPLSFHWLAAVGAHVATAVRSGRLHSLALKKLWLETATKLALSAPGEHSSPQTVSVN